MTKRMKVYLPRWLLWILFPLIAVVWGILTYMTFVSAGGRERPGILEWLGGTVVIGLVAAMLWLMTGRLPAYIIEADDDDAPAHR